MARRGDDGSRRLTLPGSERSAMYAPHEFEVMRGHYEAREEARRAGCGLGEGAVAEEDNTLRWIHGLKSEMGATLHDAEDEKDFWRMHAAGLVIEANAAVPVEHPDVCACGRSEGEGLCEACLAEVLPDPGLNEVGKFSGPSSGAPKTQQEAAILIAPESGHSRETVLDAIWKAGERGLTDEETEVATGLKGSTVRPRRNELIEQGWVVDSGRQRRVASGRNAQVWVMSDRGRAAWPA